MSYNITTEKFRKIAEKHGWAVYDGNTFLEVSQYSPAGEDFSFTLDPDNIVRDLREYAVSFDPDEHAEMWVEARKNGVSGVPSIRVLINDADDIQNMLEDLAIAVSQI